MFLLDTNVLSELRKEPTGKAHPAVVDWFTMVAEDDCYLSVMTIFELEVGILRMARSDPTQAQDLRLWVELDVLPMFGERLLPVAAPEARIAAPFGVPDPAPLSDSLIAATAVAHGMTVATRNVRDFARFPGVRVVDPWATIAG